MLNISNIAIIYDDFDIVIILYCGIRPELPAFFHSGTGFYYYVDGCRSHEHTPLCTLTTRFIAGCPL